VTPQTTVERLAERRYVTLLLRVVVDAQQQVVHGQVARVERDHWVDFVGASNLVEAVRTAIAEGTRA
jgi:hypothetical protein